MVRITASQQVDLTSNPSEEEKINTGESISGSGWTFQHYMVLVGYTVTDGRKNETIKFLIDCVYLKTLDHTNSVECV